MKSMKLFKALINLNEIKFIIQSSVCNDVLVSTFPSNVINTDLVRNPQYCSFIEANLLNGQKVLDKHIRHHIPYVDSFAHLLKVITRFFYTPQPPVKQTHSPHVIWRFRC